uniref:Metalloproteinase inhibitor 1 n=1 Tax=Xenopus tropicalis TaxID=8364 RepID=A0A803JYH4_XENTR
MLGLVVLLVLGCLSQSAYCNADFVIRARFIGKTQQKAEEPGRVTYEVKTTKIFKAPDGMDDIQFLSTPAMESLCGYEHKMSNKSQAFLITGHVMNGNLQIDQCNFIVPWASLSVAQRKGFQEVYPKSCSCSIVPCYSGTCSLESDNQCLWTDVLVNWMEPLNGSQSKYMACVDQGSGLCSWESQKPSAIAARNKAAASGSAAE